MAGTPKRAAAAEAALIGRPWQPESVAEAASAMATDFTPMSDMRASADYRLSVVANMLKRYWLEDQGTPASVLEVTP